MFEYQLGNIDIGAILIAGMFFDEFNELIAGAADGISHFQELRRLALINCVEGKCPANPGCKHEPERFFRGRYQM